MPSFAYVGSFTTSGREARGDGIHVYRTEPKTGKWTHIQHLGDLENPSFLVLSRDQRYLYSVHGDADYATAFKLGSQTGFATLLNRTNTGGANGVRQAIDSTGKFLVVANYTHGSVAVLAIAEDGSLKDQHQLIPLQGECGPDKVEQTGSHPHDVVFDPAGRFVLIPDKGLDRIFVFRFDSASGLLSPAQPDSVRTRAGAGPRHIAFHPALPVAWVLNELDNTTTVYHWDRESGKLDPIQTISTLPDDFAASNTASEIAVSPDGRFVYGSNRSHDSVVLYATDAKTGLLKTIGWESTQGKGPRFIALDPAGHFLYAANEHSDTIVTYKVNESPGELTPTGHIVNVGTPVSIVFTIEREKAVEILAAARVPVYVLPGNKD